MYKRQVLFFCVDGLPGFKDAIQAVFPQAQIQRCVIHMPVSYTPLLGEKLLFFHASLLDTIRQTHQDWLERILRIIYNSGGFLPAVPW